MGNKMIMTGFQQVLEGLEYMHNRGVAHLGLTPGDIYFSRPDGDDIKIGDFGLARRIFDNKLAALNYGMPEFVAPETANGEGVGLPADMWSVGVITYLLLSGISPFRGDTDSDTLRNVQAGQINFDPDAFKNITADAKDFIAKLLLFSADTRLTVRQVQTELLFQTMTKLLQTIENLFNFRLMVTGFRSPMAETSTNAHDQRLPHRNRSS